MQGVACIADGVDRPAVSAASHVVYMYDCRGIATGNARFRRCPVRARANYLLDRHHSTIMQRVDEHDNFVWWWLRSHIREKKLGIADYVVNAAADALATRALRYSPGPAVALLPTRHAILRMYAPGSERSWMSQGIQQST